MEGGPPIFRQDGSCPALLEDPAAGFPYGAVTRSGPPFQTLPVPCDKATGLFRVRSPLLTESRLMSVPPATEMFQFAGFASRTYEFSTGYPYGWVAPFGDPGITDRSHLPRAFRSVPRPSSPLSAKASTRCPCFALDHRRLPARRRPDNRRAQGQNPQRPKPPKGQNPAPRVSGGQAPAQAGAHKTAATSHEDTSPDRHNTLRLRPRLSASVTSQLSVHPSINTPAPSAQPRPGTVCLASPNAAAAAGGFQRSCAAPGTAVRRWWR